MEILKKRYGALRLKKPAFSTDKKPKKDKTESVIRRQPVRRVLTEPASKHNQEKECGIKQISFCRATTYPLLVTLWLNYTTRSVSDIYF